MTKDRRQANPPSITSPVRKRAPGAVKGATSKPTEIVLPPATDAVSEFKLSIPAGALDGLKTRLAMTRWPNKETVGDWSQGVPLEKMKALDDYWRTTYDMRRLEQRLNAVP